MSLALQCAELSDVNTVRAPHELTARAYHFLLLPLKPSLCCLVPVEQRCVGQTAYLSCVLKSSGGRTADPSMLRIHRVPTAAPCTSRVDRPGKGQPLENNSYEERRKEGVLMGVRSECVYAGGLSVDGIHDQRYGEEKWCLELLK